LSVRAIVDRSKFNLSRALPFDLRIADFEAVMQDVYDFFFDVNAFLSEKGLERFDDMLRPATMSGIVFDMLTASLAKHSRGRTAPPPYPRGKSRPPRPPRLWR
jgi:hypothetical protein